MRAKAVEKIISQCNTACFKDIEHLVDVYNTDAFDPSTLKRKHHLALALVAGFVSVGLSFKDMYCIKEVIFWEHHIEFHFFKTLDAKKLREKLDLKTASIVMNKMASVLEGAKEE